MRASCCVIVLPPSATRRCREVRERGAGDAAKVQRAVLMEAAILHRQQRVDQVFRNLVEPDGHPVPTALAEGRPDHLGIEQEAGEVLPLDVPDRGDAPIAPEAHPRLNAWLEEPAETKRAAPHEKIAAARPELSGLRCSAGKPIGSRPPPGGR